jgi:hypothetical protein
MKYCSLLLLLLIVSCQENASLKQKGREWRIPLKTNLGIVSIRLPETYDTSFEWIHYTDYTRGAEYKFRVQPKDLPVNMESGFFWKDLEDSVLQFTLAYHKYPNNDTNDTYTPDQHSLDYLEDEAHLFHWQHYRMDTIRTLAQHLMVVYSYEEAAKKGIRSQVSGAFAYCKGQRLSFEFVSRKPCNNSDSAFAAKCLEAIKTIRFSRR